MYFLHLPQVMVLPWFTVHTTYEASWVQVKTTKIPKKPNISEESIAISQLSWKYIY